MSWGLWGLWGLRTASDSGNVVHRTIGWNAPLVWHGKGTGKPEDIAARLKTDPEETVHDVLSSIERNFDGVGDHWTKSPEFAHKIADMIADPHGNDHHFHIIFSGTHDDEDVDHDSPIWDEADAWHEEEETPLLPGSFVNLHQMKIRPANTNDWTTVPMNRDVLTSWDNDYKNASLRSVVDHDVAEDLMKLAMPAPMPDGITFHHHPTNDTIPTEAWAGDPSIQATLFSAPAVEARHNGKTVGYLEWDPPLHATVVNGIQYGDHPPEVSMVKVNPKYQRHGIATALFDFARQHQGDLEHSWSRTSQGEKWVNYEQSRNKTAMPNPLPQGVHFRYHPELVWSPGVTAHHNGKQIGSLEWYDDDHVMVDLGTRRPGEIDRINVHPDYQGNSVASSMFDFAKQYEPRLHHSDQLTEDGRGWSEYEKSRHAALNQDLVNRLHREFHDWWHDTGYDEIHKGQTQSERGPIQWWPNVEEFLGEKYPAAHRGLDKGYEEARTLLDHGKMYPDGHPLSNSVEGYETGPESVAKHGYDPREIAAGMLLLHNRAHPHREELSGEDQHRIDEISQKRQQSLQDVFDRHEPIQGDMPQSDVDMLHGLAQTRHQQQRTYDQNSVITAGRNGDPPPMTYEPFNTMWSNGIMARHAEDGRPIAHLHWHPDGEIEQIRVHPELQGRDIAKHILAHAATHPETYEAVHGIKPSNHMTSSGQAFARSLGYEAPKDEFIEAADEEHWPWKAVENYVPLHVPYTGQNEDEMSKYLEQPWTPPGKTASTEDETWPVWWRGKHRPAGPWDKRWHPNHPEHVPAPWSAD